MAIELAENNVRNVWTQEQEAEWRRLSTLRARIYEENRHRVLNIARGLPFTFGPDDLEKLTDAFIQHAEPLRAALLPFVPFIEEKKV